jgi:hypothetical protein
MKLINAAVSIATITMMLVFAANASSNYAIGPYTVTFDGIEEYKYAGQDPIKPNEFKTDSGISYSEYSRLFWKENMQGSMTIGIDNYAVQMYKDNQDPRDVLKSLIHPNDKTTIEDITINGKVGILTKEKIVWAGGEPGVTYFLYYWLDPKTRVLAYFMESPTDKWDDMSKSMLSINVS